LIKDHLEFSSSGGAVGPMGPTQYGELGWVWWSMGCWANFPNTVPLPEDDSQCSIKTNTSLVVQLNGSMDRWAQWPEPFGVSFGTSVIIHTKLYLIKDHLEF
jgi:hypothetical protein